MSIIPERVTEKRYMVAVNARTHALLRKIKMRKKRTFTQIVELAVQHAARGVRAGK